MGGRRFADLQLDLLTSQGFDEFTFCIGYLGNQIRAHLDYHWHDLDMQFYSDDGLGGPWDAYRRLPRSIRRSRHATIYGDSYLPLTPAEVNGWYWQTLGVQVHLRWKGEDYGMRFKPGKTTRRVQAPSRYYEVGSVAGIKELEAYLS